MNEYHVAMSKTDSDYNFTKQTEALRFLPQWNLGGDDGHYDFSLWLDGCFSYSHTVVCSSVYQSLLAAAIDPIRAYDRHVLYALDMFYQEGKPRRMYPDSILEDEDYEDPYTDLNYKLWQPLPLN